MDQPPKRTYLVTGANRGIGLAIARALAKGGSGSAEQSPSTTVITVGRTDASASAARSAVLESTPDADVYALAADFASLDQVTQLAARVREEHPALDVLVHNAAITSSRRRVTKDGLELQWQVNHLAPFLLTELLRPTLGNRDGARVVLVASEAHRSGRIDWEDLGYERSRYGSTRAYSRSKLANVLHAYALARRLEGGTTTVTAVHPGVVSTRLLGSMFGPLAPLRLLFRSVEAGAAPVVRLARDPELAGTSGRYFKRFARVESSKITYDEDVQERLWQVSRDTLAPWLE